jgi:hypothetical protein
MVGSPEVTQHPPAVVTLEAEVHLHPAVVGRARVTPGTFSGTAHVIETPKRRPGRMNVAIVNAECLSDPPMRDLPELTLRAAKTDTEEKDPDHEPRHEVAGSRLEAQLTRTRWSERAR